MYTEELEKKMSEVDNQISKMQENMEVQMNEISKERLVRERLEREIIELEEELKIKANLLQVVLFTDYFEIVTIDLALSQKIIL